MDSKAPKGKLGVLIPGLGAVSTTFIAGVDAIIKKQSPPIGSLTQMGTIRLGKRTEGRNPRIKDFVSLAELKDLVFGAWDIFKEDAYQAALNAQVLSPQDLEQAREALQKVKPMSAVFDHEYVKNIDGPNKKSAPSKMHLAEMLMDDIRQFRKTNGTTRDVMIWCASTEAYIEPSDIHSSLEKFEAALRDNDPLIAPSMIYAYAALKSGMPFLMGAPNLAADTLAIQELAMAEGLPIAGKDFKTGQTLIKTILAPGLKARMLGVEGWFSTNILGNRDGEVLDDPMSFRSKEVSKKGALDYILQPATYPDLYKDLYHKVRINYYPPRGDEKEGWDNIDIFGWMGYKMQVKVNFLCRDSILAAPLVLDLVLFADLALRHKMRGIQEWLSFYFKAPMVAPDLYPEHDIFIQLTKLKNTLRWMMGEELITHVGHEYYDSYE